MDFPKIWPLTCHNWVKDHWPRTKNNTTNREYSARATCWYFPRSSTTLRLETPGGCTPPPPPLHRRRCQNTVYGRGLNVCWILETVWVHAIGDVIRYCFNKMSEYSSETREGIHRHALLQVRPIWDPKTAAAIHVTKTAGVHTSHGGKTSAGRVSGGTPMQAENMERRALMTATQIESVTAVQNVGRRLLEEAVFIATKTYIQGKNGSYVMIVGNRLLAEII